MALKIETHRVTSTEVLFAEDGSIFETGDTAFLVGEKVFTSVRSAEAYHAKRSDGRTTMTSVIHPE